ncbi:MAG TPA: acyl-CoA dehydrogenase family protein [Candidatus Dormibacteraeota bacterium]|nr:acyl-CoA dehydrogenase family protein [Candidatus Dormibacteraeota bacterium]
MVAMMGGAAASDRALRAFAAEVAELAHARVSDPRQYFRGRGGPVRELQRELGERDWLAVSWPVEHGGQGRPLTYEFTLWNTLAYHRATRPELGATIVARLLMRHGTAEQRSHYLPLIRAGQICFALGYSEPEAGSDLASVRTRATRDGDVYRVDGEKVWTSEAHHAEYLWCLCRSGAQADHGRALTLLIVDLAAPGVSVQPIPTIDGHHVNQVRLDGVAVPVSARVGAENGAWDLVREGLAVERHVQFLPGRTRRDLETVIDMCRRSGRLEGEDAQVRLASLAAQVMAAEATAIATVGEAEVGATSPVAAGAAKLLGSRLAQDIADAAFDICGAEALDQRDMAELLWRESVMETIAGGTTEMLLGIVARTALALPRSS